MRWVCGTCVIIAIFVSAACSPYPADGAQFVCSGTCASNKQDVAFWCAGGPTQVVIDIVEPGRAFRTCMADHGYVEPEPAGVGTPNIQTASLVPQLGTLRKKTPKTKKTGKARKSKGIAKGRRSKTRTQGSQSVALKQPAAAPERKEFDPLDLFKNPSGVPPSNVDE